LVADEYLEFKIQYLLITFSIQDTDYKNE
jgi:hypothetical protein